jgi:hypothetical protein
MQNSVHITIKLKTTHSIIRKESLNYKIRVLFYNNTISNIRRK